MFQRDGRIEAKTRPALVLETTDSGVRVAWGTSTERDRPHVRVCRAERAGTAWQLSGDTWFYGNTQTVAAESIQKIVPPPVGRMADPKIVVALRALAT
jgi:hypothetical protein